MGSAGILDAMVAEVPDFEILIRMSKLRVYTCTRPKKPHSTREYCGIQSQNTRALIDYFTFDM